MRLIPRLSTRALRGVLLGVIALERGERRGLELIRRHAVELRGLAGYRPEAVEALLVVAGVAPERAAP